MKQDCGGMRVIVTAASAGIGWTIAETFLQRGARVHICGRSEERLAQCRTRMPDVGTTVADVSDPFQVERLFRDALAHLGGLDVLVNNCGIAGPTLPVEKITPDDWQRTLAVNINSQFYCARLAIPLLKEAGGGSIINLGSTASLFGFARRSPYAASKWAVIGFTKTLALELGEFGIRANAICPGCVEGDRINAVIAAEAQARGLSVEAIRDGYIRETALRTFVTARDIAGLVLYLCSEAGNKISGQALTVDGFTETCRS
jgi:NAD(P)-dependent dehydrogenase (short-subunit alcohol dehydrogenase family)